MKGEPSQQALNALRAALGQGPAPRARAHIEVTEGTIGDQTLWMVTIELASGGVVDREFGSPTAAVEWASKWAADRALALGRWEAWVY